MLIYLAATNAVPAWTRTRNWTVALLAFTIHAATGYLTPQPDTHNLDNPQPIL
jgi:hypothetical protein